MKVVLNTTSMIPFEECMSWLDGFLKAWTNYANYLFGLTGLRKEDYDICKAVLKVLKSDTPERLIRELYSDGPVSRKTLNDAEGFDRSLNKLKTIPLPVDNKTKKDIECFCNTCVSFYRFVLEGYLQKEGRLTD